MTNEELCIVEGCSKVVKVKMRGLCNSHYQAWSRNNKPRVGVHECTMEDCSKVLYARGYCESHYTRFRKTGSPQLLRELPKPLCSAEDCEKQAVATGLCKAHYSNKWYYEASGTGLRDTNPSEATSYQGAHYRVRRLRGRAADYVCVCGCGKQATDWALKADATDLRFGSASTNRPARSAYSNDPYDYQPMTSDCHRAYDAQHHNRSYLWADSRWSA